MEKERKTAVLEKANDHYTGKFSYTGENRRYDGEIGEIVKRVNPVFSANVPEERFEEEKLKGPYLFLVLQMELPEGICTSELGTEMGTRMHIPSKYLERIVDELQKSEWEVRVE